MESKEIFDDITNQLDRIGIETDLPIVHAIFVNDHSGSMDLKIDHTENGQKRSDLATSNFNEQLAKIQRESGDVITSVTVIEFDDRIIINKHFLHQIQFSKHDLQITFPADEVKPLTDWWTLGATSLRDAIGAAVAIGSTLLADHDTDDQSVLVMILTDGEENNSKEWTDDMVKEKIKQLEDSGRWTFTFMGGQLQANDMITKMGFSAGNTRSMSQTTASWSASSKISNYGLDKYYMMRKAGTLGTKEFFTEEEQLWQQKERENT